MSITEHETQKNKQTDVLVEFDQFNDMFAIFVQNVIIMSNSMITIAENIGNYHLSSQVQEWILFSKEILITKSENATETIIFYTNIAKMNLRTLLEHDLETSSDDSSPDESEYCFYLLDKFEKQYLYLINELNQKINQI